MRPPSDSSALRMPYSTPFLRNDSRSAVTVYLPARGNTCSVSRNRACDFVIECKISKHPPSQSGLRPCPAGSRPARRSAPAAAAALWTRPTRAFGEPSRVPSCPPPVRRRTAVAAGLIFASAVRSCSGRLAVCCSVARSEVLVFRLVHSSRSRFGRHRRASDDSGPPTGLERFVLPGS
jgi:hypothetical protein